MPIRPIDYLGTAAVGAVLVVLCAIALRWPSLPVSRVFRKLFASRGLSPRTNLIVLGAVGVALVVLGLVLGSLDR
jgi:hypothetical protein